ncbi:MAG: hypothetical protein HRT45_13725 [Bdellovibrionales bacterium]|nr:hypothetical protein [Bdellovibrionales bacterium]
MKLICKQCEFEPNVEGMDFFEAQKIPVLKLPLTVGKSYEVQVLTRLRREAGVQGVGSTYSLTVDSSLELEIREYINLLIYTDNGQWEELFLPDEYIPQALEESSSVNQQLSGIFAFPE